MEFRNIFRCIKSVSFNGFWTKNHFVLVIDFQYLLYYLEEIIPFSLQQFYANYCQYKMIHHCDRIQSHIFFVTMLSIIDFLLSLFVCAQILRKIFVLHKKYRQHYFCLLLLGYSFMQWEFLWVPPCLTFYICLHLTLKWIIWLRKSIHCLHLFHLSSYCTIYDYYY